MTQSIIRYIVVSLLAYLVGHGVITQAIADANAGKLVNYILIGISLFGAIFWSYFEKESKGVLDAYFNKKTSGRMPPSAVVLLLAIPGVVCALLFYYC